ncbi:MAG: signal peptidase II, partial [Oscillospiraceae bacterium]|nr:signal peptidase II [Oscillospiraceae bacterium]
MLIIAALCIIAIVGADQLIKSWLVDEFLLQEERPFLQIGNLDILHLHYIENNGSAFSSFAGQRVMLLVVTAVSIAVCCYILCRYARKGKPLLFWSLVMVIGGGFGNMIDRIFRDGAVVDYLDVQLFDFAIFNFADCFV